ncbi:unnamed protein product [Trichobilharzia regenti]|nr:unnamed protein product [Trichobilharzia regenti]
MITMNRIRSNGCLPTSSSSSTMTKHLNPLDQLLIKSNILNPKKKPLCSLDLCIDPVENVLGEVDRNVFR